MSTFEEICRALRSGEYRVTDHGTEEMSFDGLLEADVIEATVDGEVIEDYPTAFPCPACLVLGHLDDGSAIHAVWAYDGQRCYSLLVTAYRPDPARWSEDFRRRVKK
jgi:hypothetical protein